MKNAFLNSVKMLKMLSFFVLFGVVSYPVLSLSQDSMEDDDSSEDVWGVGGIENTLQQSETTDQGVDWPNTGPHLRPGRNIYEEKGVRKK